jgi:hypothetical protein
MLIVATALLGNAIEGPIGSDRRIYKSVIEGSEGDFGSDIVGGWSVL